MLLNIVWRSLDKLVVAVHVLLLLLQLVMDCWELGIGFGNIMKISVVRLLLLTQQFIVNLGKLVWRDSFFDDMSVLKFYTLISWRLTSHEL